MTEAADRALDAARRGRAALSSMQIKDAAWMGLHALDLDETCGLAWALLAHILTEATQDPVGTWATHNALLTGLPDPEQAHIARYHRVDMWTRGLLAHASGQAILTGADLEDADAFRPTPRMQGWLQSTSDNWGGAEGVLRAVRRMVAALSDAWTVPEAEDALRDDVLWANKPEFEAWCADDPLANDQAVDFEPPPELPPDVRILSDYWMHEEVIEVCAAQDVQTALEKAKLWTSMRPEGMTAQLALLQVHAAMGDDEAKTRVANTVTSLSGASLEDKETARMTLGALGLWQHQLQILDQMAEEAPGHPIILTNRSITKLKLDDEVGAAIDLDTVLMIDPDNPVALANLGLVRMRQGEYEAAGKLLNRAAEVAPGEADIFVYRSVWKNNQDDAAGALADLRRALVLDPEHAEGLRLMKEFDEDQSSS